MLNLEPQITGRTAWLRGKDNAGVVRYAPADAITIPIFARDTLGNFYAAVDTVVGYGIRARGSGHWDVLDTPPEERELARMMHGTLTDTGKSASA
jgi:hypothetical protein